MSIHLPGSVLSRALRSRLIQQRLINTHPYRLNRPAALVGSRLYSTAESAPDETVPNQDNETPVWRLPRERGLSWRKASAASSPGNDGEREAEGRMLMAIASGSSGSRGGASISPKKIEMEVKWLADPLALAYRVERLLQAGDPAMAAALVRQAQKNGQGCEVAWNNLMRYCMIRGHPNAAFKFYNDVSSDVTFRLESYGPFGNTVLEVYLTDSYSMADEKTWPDAKRENLYYHAQGLQYCSESAWYC